MNIFDSKAVYFVAPGIATIIVFLIIGLPEIIKNRKNVDAVKYRHTIICNIGGTKEFKSAGPVMYSAGGWAFKCELSGKFIRVKADCIDYIDESIKP